MQLHNTVETGPQVVIELSISLLQLPKTMSDGTFFVVVFSIEIRVLHMLGKCCIN